MIADPLVRIQGVSKTISSKNIIHDFTLDIPYGVVFGFLGPNGAGKTTMIKMMLGLSSMSKGEILIEGHSIKTKFKQAIAHVGAIVENPEMYPFLTGYQNLLHFARMSPGVTKSRIDEVIHQVGLENRIHSKLKTYSLGMRQRLGIAQAILHRPKLLILDEPTNGLDPQGIKELRQHLQKLSREQHTTVFISSHVLSEMELMCDRVAIIQHGKLLDVRDIDKQEQNNDDCEVEVCFEVDDVPKGLQTIEQSWSTHSHLLFVHLTREHIPHVTKTLLDSGVQVYAVSSAKQTLEDQFLQITGGNDIS